MHRARLNGWAFIMPAMVLIGLFNIYPILSSLWMSFQTGRGMNLSFGGFDNIIRLTQDPVFLAALINTITYFVVQVPIMLVLALLMASLLNNPDLRFRGILRTAIFLPCVTSLVAYAILFKSMFTSDGVVNQTLMTVFFMDEPINWLTDPFWAKVLVILGVTWRWTGYNMIFYLAAMQNIDRSIYEAARVDGVPPWAVFTKLTVPMLKPIILFTCIISTIGTLQLFDEVMNLTEGGPGDATLTLSMYIYNLTFRFMPSFGYAATVSYVIVLLVAILSFIQFQVARDRE